jgi:DNA-binding MarR family transcriptional regulator
MAARTFRIRFSRNGNEFEAEGDKAFVLAMLKRFETGAGGDSQTAIATTNANTEASRSKSRQASKAISIREFVQQLGLKKHTDITLAFGYFLEHQAGAATFTPADINSCYYDAKIEASNTSQMIIQNIRRGYVMQSRDKTDKGRKRYTLTTSGEKYIEAKLKATT